MKCILAVQNGKERMQRSCELPLGIVTCKQLRAFVQSQDLRLASTDFSYAVRIKSGNAAAREEEEAEEEVVLQSDTDLQLLLGKVQLETGAMLVFEVIIHATPASPCNAGSFMSTEFGVDEVLVKLLIYPPTTSHLLGNPDFQEKMFIIPTRFVFKSLLRAVEDTLSVSPARQGVKLALFVVQSQQYEGRPGTEIADDDTALKILREHGAQRTPVRLTYEVVPLTSKASSRLVSRSTSQQNLSGATPPRATPDPQRATASTPRSTSHHASKPSSPSPPPQTSGYPQAPVPQGRAAPSPSPPPESTPPRAPPASPTPSPSPALSSAEAPDTPHRAFLREAPAPVSKSEVRVRVCASAAKAETEAGAHEFLFSYAKTEVQLCQRFAEECRCAASLKEARHMPVIASDESVELHAEATLREWLALAKESQQPLRVRLLVPPTPPSPKVPSPSTASAAVLNTPASVQRNDCAAASTSAASIASAAASSTASSARSPSSTPYRSSSSRKAQRTNETANAIAAASRRLEELRQKSTPPSPSVTPAKSPAPPPPLPPGNQTKVDSAAAAAAPAAVPSTSNPPVDLSEEKNSSMTSEVVTTVPAAANKLSDADVPVDSPPVVMYTAPGSSGVRAAAALATGRCACIDNKELSSIRFQVCARWGKEQRVILCRLRVGNALKDLQHAALTAFTRQHTAAPVSTEFLAIQAPNGETGIINRHNLSSELQFLELRDQLMVETAELHVPPPAIASTGGGAAQQSEGAAPSVPPPVARLLAVVILYELRKESDITNEVIERLFQLHLGETAAEALFADLHTVVCAQPFALPQPTAATKMEAQERLIIWLTNCFSNGKFSKLAPVEAASEVTARILRTCVRDRDFLLEQFQDTASNAHVEASSSFPGRATLAAMWTDAGFEDLEGSSLRVWDIFRATHIGGGKGWTSAYAAAPAAVLDLIAAGCMDGLWSFPHPENSEAEKAVRDTWRRGLEMAQRECCDQISSAEVEKYFKVSASAEEDVPMNRNRDVILSCVGALLAPSLPLTTAPTSNSIDYAQWLIQHFRGKVATVLHNKMMLFDGASSLPLFTVVVLAWTLLHPLLRPPNGDAPLPDTLEHLRSWALIAIQRVCLARRIPFPPCPLYNTHTADPRPVMRTVAVAKKVRTEDVDGEAVSRGQAEPSVGSAPTTATPSAAAISASHVVPPSGSSQPVTRRDVRGKVHYEFKYKFDTLHLPRLSKA